MTPISLLGDLVSLGTLVAFMIVCFSVLYLRRTQPQLPRPFRTPLMPVTPVLGILTCGYLVYSIFFGSDQSGHIVVTESGHAVLKYTGPYCLIGAFLYIVYGSRKSHLTHGEPAKATDPKFMKKPHEPRTD